MTKRKGKPVSFDAMVKFFMMNYNIPSKSDLEKVIVRLDRLERLIRSLGLPPGDKPSRNSAGVENPPPARLFSKTASEIVFETIRQFPEGAGFSEIQAATGFEEKKLRNIIFRLNKLKRIRRISRGVYAAV